MKSIDRYFLGALGVLSVLAMACGNGQASAGSERQGDGANGPAVSGGAGGPGPGSTGTPGSSKTGAVKLTLKVK